MDKLRICVVTFFVLVVDIVTEFTREGALNEQLYADDLVLMSDTIDGLRDNFLKWTVAFESKCLKVNILKTKVMVSGSITKDGMCKYKVDPMGVSCLEYRLTQCCVCNAVSGFTVNVPV